MIHGRIMFSLCSQSEFLHSPKTDPRLLCPQKSTILYILNYLKILKTHHNPLNDVSKML